MWLKCGLTTVKLSLMLQTHAVWCAIVGIQNEHACVIPILGGAVVSSLFSRINPKVTRREHEHLQETQYTAQSGGYTAPK